MVTVTGRLSDYGLAALEPFHPTLKFIPSGAGLAGSRLLATRPVVAYVNPAGVFSVSLQPTDGVSPARWYSVVAEWLGAGGEYTQITVWERLYVPIGGGDISTFPGRPFTAFDVWVGLDDNPPPPGFRGWWLVAAEGNPDPGDETGSGDLRMVY